MADPFHPQPSGKGVDLEVALSVIPSLPRRILERLVQRAIERLDDMDGCADDESNGAEDDFCRHRRDKRHGAGCPISDPGGCEHDGREPEHEC